MSLSGDTALFTPMPRLKLPDYLLKNMKLSGSREYKTLKRTELREVLKAIDKFRRGCAWIPPLHEFNLVAANLERMKQAMSVKEWGR